MTIIIASIMCYHTSESVHVYDTDSGSYYYNNYDLTPFYTCTIP